MQEFMERSMEIYRTVRTLAEGVEAFMKEAAHDEDFACDLMEEGARTRFHHCRQIAQSDALAVNPPTRGTTLRPEVMQRIRAEAKERGKDAATAQNRTARLQGIFAFPLFDNTPLGNATLAKIDKQIKFNESLAKGNLRSAAKFKELRALMVKNGAKGSKQALDVCTPAEVDAIFKNWK